MQPCLAPVRGAREWVAHGFPVGLARGLGHLRAPICGIRLLRAWTYSPSCLGNWHPTPGLLSRTCKVVRCGIALFELNHTESQLGVSFSIKWFKNFKMQCAMKPGPVCLLELTAACEPSLVF